MEEDNGDYYDGHWRDSDYLCDRPLCQASFAGDDNNYPTGEIELGDIDGWNTDFEVGGCYWVNRSAVDDYRDSDRTSGRDAFKVLARANSVRSYEGESERAIKRFESHLRKYANNFKSSRKSRFQNNDRRSGSGRRQAEMAEEVGVYLAIDYGQRMEGMSPGGGGVRLFRMWIRFSL